VAQLTTPADAVAIAGGAGLTAIAVLLRRELGRR